MSCFNPRPAPSCGATAMGSRHFHPDRVSIRAPHLRAGRQVHPHPQVTVRKFQSAPRTFVRGDVSKSRWAEEREWFQSAPRTFVRGDVCPGQHQQQADGFNPRPAPSCGATDGQIGKARNLLVSIRTPHLRAGRLKIYDTIKTLDMFQSAPRTFVRGDRWLVCTSIPTQKFQSAPRTFVRGDSGRCKLRSHKKLIHYFRQPGYCRRFRQGETPTKRWMLL